MPLSLEKRLAKRATTLAVARSLLAREGYDGTTMLQIAREAKVAPATLYNVFGSKQNLLREAVEELFLALVNLARQRAGAGGVDRIASLEQYILDEYERNPGYARNLLIAASRSESGRSLFATLNRVHVETIELGIGEMRAQGHLADWVQPRKLARAIEDMLRAASSRWAYGGGTVGELRSEAMLGIYLVLLGAATEAARDDLENRIRMLDTQDMVAAGG
ncbi:MAG: TetR/AcrR family transcriptional regulator [Dehalococcoidia bacterium]|nr:TetR/AcrR family transcriptional regulator [Dehalococcoidia bacterium]